MQDHEFVLDAGGNVSLTLVRLLRWMARRAFCWPARTSPGRAAAPTPWVNHAAGREVAFDPAMHQRLKNLWGEGGSSPASST
jgi:hypothetical protein